ncbi:MAG: VOC family protein [Acetatifactor sp.]
MEKKIEIIPYLSFNGNCEEALKTYIEAFGGEIYGMSRWSEETYEVTPKQIGKVMHAEFALGNTHMAAGDVFDGTEVNTGVKLMIHMDSQEAALHTISVLAEGGTVLSPLKPHPKPDDGGCGSVTKDRFGFTWIITCPNPAKQ